MKKFNYADREIVFDDDFVFFHPYRLLLERQILEYVDEWEDRKKNTTSLDDYLRNFSSYFTYAKNSLASLAVKILIENDIYEFDESRFLDRYGQELDARNFDTYRQLVNRKANIVNAYNESEQYKAIQRASRSRWTGGGFGISGAIKGAVKAGAMNAVTGAVRGIGDSIRDSADQKEYKERLSSIINKYDEAHLLDDMFAALVRGIEFNLFEIMERRIGFDASIVMRKCDLAAQSMFNNLKREASVRKRVELYEKILCCNPYEWEYVLYALNGTEDEDLTNAIGLDNMRRIAEYLEPLEYQRMTENEVYDRAVQVIEGNISLSLKIEKLLKLGIDYDCFDEQFHINENLRDIGEAIIFNVIYLEVDVYREKYRFTEESEKSYEKISHYIDFIKEILEEYGVYIEGKINSQYNESEFWQGLKEDLKSLEDKKRKAYTSLCTSKDGHIYDSPEKAVLHNQEKVIFDKILKAASPYMVYEKSILEELIKNLEENNFQSKYIVEDINKLKRKLIVLRGHETTKHYEQGRELRALFEAIGDCAGICLYGKPGFVETSMKIAKKTPTLEEDLNTYFPILIVGKGYQEEVFKGIIITDEYIVVSGYLLVSDLRRPWNTLNKITVNKNKIELHFSEKTLKFKMSEEVAYIQVLEILARYLKIMFEVNGTRRNYTEDINNNHDVQSIKPQDENHITANKVYDSSEKEELNRAEQSQVSNKKEKCENLRRYNDQDTIALEKKEICQESGDANCGDLGSSKAIYIKKRRFIIYLLLTFLTCGIYSLYFWYRYTEDVNKICDGDGRKSPNYIVVVLLSCITLGIYNIYWRYVQTNRLYKAGLKYKVPIREKGVSIVLLYISSFITYYISVFVAQYIMIYVMNKFANVGL